MLSVERIRELAREALACGADPRLAERILCSTVKSPEILERRLLALFDTVPDHRERERLADLAWGPGGLRKGRKGFPGADL